MVKVAKRSFETTWVNQFFRHYGSDVSYRQSDLRAWRVNLLDVVEVGRTGIVIDGDKLDAPGAWWKIEGYTANAELLHVSVIAVTDYYFVEIIDVARKSGRSGDDDETGNAA